MSLNYIQNRCFSVFLTLKINKIQASFATFTIFTLAFFNFMFLVSSFFFYFVFVLHHLLSKYEKAVLHNSGRKFLFSLNKARPFHYLEPSFVTDACTDISWLLWVTRQGKRPSSTVVYFLFSYFLFRREFFIHQRLLSS